MVAKHANASRHVRIEPRGSRQGRYGRIQRIPQARHVLRPKEHLNRWSNARLALEEMMKAVETGRIKEIRAKDNKLDDAIQRLREIRHPSDFKDKKVAENYAVARLEHMRSEFGLDRVAKYRKRIREMKISDRQKRQLLDKVNTVESIFERHHNTLVTYAKETHEAVGAGLIRTTFRSLFRRKAA